LLGPGKGSIKRSIEEVEEEEVAAIATKKAKAKVDGLFSHHHQPKDAKH
jgi:hypothetical protein